MAKFQAFTKLRVFKSSHWEIGSIGEFNSDLDQAYGGILLDLQGFRLKSAEHKHSSDAIEKCDFNLEDFEAIFPAP